MKVDALKPSTARDAAATDHVAAEVALSPTLIELFQVFALLHAGSQALVYKALRRSDQRPVILKVTLAEFPTAATIARFRLEHELLAQLQHPHIITSHECIRIGTRAALVLEDRNAVPLPELLQQRDLSLADRLGVALQLAEALQAVHAAGIIHGDMRPDNILVDPMSLAATLSDFGSAVKTTGQLPSQWLGAAESTLYYQAPEQSGRHSRSIDQRSDLYSFGVVLFELVTGHLPFVAKDDIELMHLHSAKAAPLASHLNPAVPVLLERLIAKLLAKDPDARYQRCTSLCEDLEYCIRALRAGDSAADYELAANDFSSRLSRQYRLYGRDEAMGKLRAWTLAPSANAGSVLCLSGDAGIGKSALMHELRNTLLGVHFGFGRYDQLTRHMPYKGLIDALKDALRPILALPPAELELWRQRLVAEVAGSGGVLTSIIPELAQIIGAQAEPERLPEAQHRNRFASLIKKLIAWLHPTGAKLVLFLDDVQWSDGGSFDLLKTIVSNPQGKGVMVVLAYRHAEVGSSHPLVECLSSMRHPDVACDQLALTGLSLGDVQTILSEALKQPLEACLDLAEMIYDRTQGNPLFVGETLQKLIHEKMIAFDVTRRAWTWDLARISQLPWSEDVVELIAERLQHVSSGCRSLLQMASCLGATFSLKELCLVAPDAVSSVGSRLWEAVEAQLLSPVAGDFHLLSALDQAVTRDDPALTGWTFRFAHDRVRQASRLGLSEDQAAAYHLVIGQFLVPQLTAASSVALLYAAVAHLNAAKSLLPAAVSRRNLAILNGRAGAQALAAVAHQAARNYFLTSLELIAPVNWEDDFALAWEFSLGLLEASHLARDDAAFDRLHHELLQRAKTDEQRVRVLTLRLHSYISARDFTAALAVGLEALQLFGVHLPEQPGVVQMALELIKTKRSIGARTIDDLRLLPQMHDPQHLRVMQLLMTMTAPVYFIRPNLFPILVFKMIQLALRHGHSPVSAYAFNVYGVLLCAAFGNIKAGYAFGRFGLELLESMDSRELRGKTVMVFHSSVHHWKEPLREALPEFVRAYQAATAVGDFEYAALSGLGFCAYSYLAGLDLASLEPRFLKYIGALSEMREWSHLPLIKIFAQAAANLRRLDEQPYRLEGEFWASASDDARLTSQQDKTTLCVKNIVAMQLAYLFGEFELAGSCAEKATKDQASIVGTAYLPVFVFYHALTLIRLAEATSGGRRKKALLQARRLERRMRRWAMHCPANYQHKLHLMQAEIARVSGRYQHAAQLYERAASEASQQQYVQDEALAHELAGYFHLAVASRKASGFYLREAAVLYDMWGARGKAAMIRRQYQSLLASPQGRLDEAMDQGLARSATGNSSALHLPSGHGFDITTMMKASRAIFSDLEPDKLYRNLMSIMIENAGCERGLIILEDAGAWFVEAAADVNVAEGSTAQHIPLSAAVMPMSVFHSVVNSKKSLIIADASSDDLFGQDPWVRAKKVRSMLCIPLLRQDAVCGVLYLENNAMSGSFTTAHIDLLNVLASQIAVSIDHAKMYVHLEQRVRERTSELSASLVQLNNAQTELVQAEKMAALGHMVAGVAHEINTPLGIGITVASTIRHDTKTIIQAVQKGIKRSELDAFLAGIYAGAQMLERNLSLVASQVNQFKRVSVPTGDVGLDYFSPKEAIQTAVDGFKLQFSGLSIAIEVDCPDDLIVASFPDAWTQIVYNMLKNAVAHAFKPGQSGTITIALRPDGGDYVWTFTDNGRGMEPAELDKIFEPFYTTSRSGGNMGLGLHVIFNLVHQQLRSKITCTSQPGVGTTFKITINGTAVTQAKKPGTGSPT